MNITELTGIITPILLVFLAIFGALVFQTYRRDQFRREATEERRYRDEREDQLRRDERDLHDRKEQRKRDAHLASDRSEQLRYQRLIIESALEPAGTFMLTLSTDDPLVVVRAIAAVQDLYVDHGFERPQIEEVWRGSVKVKMSTRIAAFFREPRAREIGAELKIAAEEISLGRYFVGEQRTKCKCGRASC